jgi:hypothetical protein
VVKVVIVVTYGEREREIQRMCSIKCLIIPVIIGAAGMVTKGLKKNVEAMPGKRTVKQ